MCPNTPGKRRTSCQVAYPPELRPATAREDGERSVAYVRSTWPSTSCTSICPYAPFPGESTHWLPPSEVKPSGNTVRNGGTPEAKTASMRSRIPGVKGAALNQPSAEPMNACRSTTTGYRGPPGT